MLAEIEADEELAVQRAARAAYGRGQIAEEQVRWHDAAGHYAMAARRHPTYRNLYKAREFAWRAGDYAKATAFGEELVETARTEFAEDAPEFAEALNEHALTLKNAERYEDAEPLYRRAIEIAKATIGEMHPDYATHLNNLAELLRNTGHHDEAEPLFFQAIQIDKATIGEEHPSYATRLNNLALLLRDMHRFDEAKPLFSESLTIFRNVLGDNHPSTLTVAGTHARLLRANFPDDPALAELEATFGPDIGN